MSKSATADLDGAGPESILTIVVMDSLICNCTSKLAALRRPGMTRPDLRRTCQKQHVGQITRSCPAPFAKIFRFPIYPNQFYDRRRPIPKEGRIAIVTDAGLDAVDAAASGAQMCSQGGLP